MPDSAGVPIRMAKVRTSSASVDSVFRRDYPVIQGGLLLIAGIIMVVNLIVDLLYGLINPRIRH